MPPTLNPIEIARPRAMGEVVRVFDRAANLQCKEITFQYNGGDNGREFSEPLRWLLALEKCFSGPLH